MDTKAPRKKVDCSGSTHPVSDILEKHKRYGDVYGQNELYWGLGIECESYLEMPKPVLVKSDFIINNHGRERYSVDYYKSYKKTAFEQAIDKFKPVQEVIPLPVLVNAHALNKTDTQFRHQTLYSKVTLPNPEFSGKTIYELIEHARPEFFQENQEKNFTFDGDSIEIMTQGFYKTTVRNVIHELKTTRLTFLENLRAVFSEIEELQSLSDIRWTSGNHGFAVMATNPKNLAIFNNGTYHINITLPTKLNNEGKIADWPLFLEDHRNYIRYIQWLEPLLVANFGSPDPLAWLVEGPFALGSQRGAMSRYIGLGTFDSKTMPKGKILTMDLSGVRSTWYGTYHKSSGYVPLEKIGLDINFNKHWNHGVELRFFDWFPEERLHGLLKLLVYLGDVATTRPCMRDPLDSTLWNTWMVRVMRKGAAAGLTEVEAKALTEVFGFQWKASNTLESVLADVYNYLKSTYCKGGPCSKYFLQDSPIEEFQAVEVADVTMGCCCFPKQPKKREILEPCGGGEKVVRSGGGGGGGAGGAGKAKGTGKAL
jgi:hypothetical protein